MSGRGEKGRVDLRCRLEPAGSRRAGRVRVKGKIPAPHPSLGISSRAPVAQTRWALVLQCCGAQKAAFLRRRRRSAPLVGDGGSWSRLGGRRDRA
jgi:hypothetical protein